MRALKIVYEEIAGLFIDDGSLALWSLVLIVVVTALAKLTPLPAICAGGLLLIGCLGILAQSVRRAVRQQRSPH